MKYRILQGGLNVAGADILGMAFHYFIVYSLDGGVVRLQEKVGKKWKTLLTSELSNGKT